MGSWSSDSRSFYHLLSSIILSTWDWNLVRRIWNSIWWVGAGPCVFAIIAVASVAFLFMRLDDADEKENKKKAREEMLKTANMRWTVDYRHHRRHHHHILHMRWVNLTN